MPATPIDAKQAIATVLHVPYTYFPDPCGGTEVYVRALAQRLGARGYRSVIAAPDAAARQYEDEALEVHRFATGRGPRLAYAYGVPDEVAAIGFRAVFERVRPDIVHLHARTSAVSERVVDVAREGGATVVFTYHTPTVSCLRGTMMLEGREPCDGVIERRRCVACSLTARGASTAVARWAAAAPATIAEAIALVPVEGKPWSALRIPGLMSGSGARFHRFIGKVDEVVAVCQWVEDVLRRNGVPPQKITLSRQGLAHLPSLGRPLPAAHGDAGRDGEAPLRIAYFGRIDRAKGPDLLAAALPLVRDAPVLIDIYAVMQSGTERAAEALTTSARGDARLRVLAAVRPDEVVDVMSSYDLIAIPSRLLETGPLVALEAFAAGVPVLGADLGGIAELVRDGVDGLLVQPDAPEAWALAISRLAKDRGVVSRLAAGIRPPRTMDAAADDMATVYARAQSACGSTQTAR